MWGKFALSSPLQILGGGGARLPLPSVIYAAGRGAGVA